MMRTSKSHPLQIAEVSAGPGYGRIGITFCPGKRDCMASTGAWARDLATDLDVIAAWGARLVLTLVEPAELRLLEVTNLGVEVRQRGMLWCHLPISDFSVPSAEFELQWQTQGKEIRALLCCGADVLVHCKGGLGRAGMMAARLLVELGMPPEQAIREVRRVRKGAIETPAQLAVVRRSVTLGDWEEERVLDSASLQQIGRQLGSNPAGVYQDGQGGCFYVKTLESVALARNEWLAARLYRLAGAPTLEYVRTKDPCQVATKMVQIQKRSVSQFTEAERKQAQQWLGVHAWTANWDAAGFSGENQALVDGRVLTLDVGGALAFRAMGDPKGQAFGPCVSELATLRQDRDNPFAVRLFGDMNQSDIQAAIRVVTRIPDERISEDILLHGGSQALAEKMLARKADMLRQLQKEFATS